jgi:hypothetical protein
MSERFENHSLSKSDVNPTKSELIQRILDSFKPSKSSSDSTTNTSLSSIDKTTISCQLNQIYIHFKDKNELGLEPQIDELLEKIEYTKNCSCHRMEIIFNNQILNQQLSYKQKQSILRIILRRQQIFNRYFS